MARWKLTAPHYLNVPGEEWEQIETSRETGRQVKIKHKVPRYLDPENPADCNRDGDCVVCHESKGVKGDLTFFGTPTPYMEPLDDEATRITEKEKPNWTHPIESLPSSMSASMAPKA